MSGGKITEVNAGLFILNERKKNTNKLSPDLRHNTKVFLITLMCKVWSQTLKGTI